MELYVSSSSSGAATPSAEPRQEEPADGAQLPLRSCTSEMTFPPGRVSPCHDLGYHTLLTRATPTPTLPSPIATPSPPSKTSDCQTRLSPGPWGDIPSSRSSPFPSAQETNGSSGSSRPPSLGRAATLSDTERCGRSALSDTERLITTFKGKKVPKSSPFDRLSDDLILRVFSFLSSNQLCVCARVCRRWYFLTWEPQLWTSVTLSGDRIHVDRGLKTLFRLLCRDSPTVCLTVERIALNGCSRLTDKGLCTVAARCPELKTLELRGCSNVTNNGISEVVSRCPNLEKLDVTGTRNVRTLHRDYSLDVLTQEFQRYNLDILGLQETRRTGKGCNAVTSIQSRPLTPDSSGAAGRQLYLQYLDLTDCQGIQDSGLQLVVRHCSQLSHLYLRRCSQVTDAGLKAVASYCVILRELSVSDCVHVTDFGLYELAKLGPNLRYLSVAKCDQVSDAGIKQIARHCYKLRYLNVRGCEAVSDDSMEVIARSCPRLRALDIGKCDVTDHGLRLISEHCPNLRKLSVKSCEMITDHGIQIIAYYCRGLQQLNIQDCSVTLDGYKTVKKFCKRCIIEHTNPGFS